MVDFKRILRERGLKAEADFAPKSHRPDSQGVCVQCGSVLDLSDAPSECPGPYEFKCTGIRTSCIYPALVHSRIADRKFVELDLELRFLMDEWWINILNGVTGFESCSVKDFTTGMYQGRKGWTACAGTTGRWDSLFVPFSECKKILKWVEGVLKRINGDEDEEK